MSGEELADILSGEAHTNFTYSGSTVNIGDNSVHDIALLMQGFGQYHNVPRNLLPNDSITQKSAVISQQIYAVIHVMFNAVTRKFSCHYYLTRARKGINV